MRPDGVDDKRQKGESSEEDRKQGPGYVSAELCPVREGHPPHVIGEHHAAVECMDHHPLVSSPKQGAHPASLSSMKRKDGERNVWGGRCQEIFCLKFTKVSHSLPSN